MRILIANLDYENDPFNESFNSSMDRIREYNTKGSARTHEIFDPYGEVRECTLGGVEKVFGYSRKGMYTGIIEQNMLYKDVFIDSYGYNTIKILPEIKVNPIYMPFLSQDILIAYMPHVPWDEFGNHLRLEGEDAMQLISLWNRFLRQNRDLYNAIYNVNYPLDECRSSIGYIYMEHEID